jgi:hypothetical protein
MAKDNLKKELYKLMAQSAAIQSLSMEERIEMQDKILALGPEEMRRVLEILKAESRESAETKKQASREDKEVKKLAGMVQSMREAGRTLDKAFLGARESSDRAESTKITDTLLNKISEL